MKFFGKVDLFLFKFFRSYYPAFVASIDAKNDYIECELLNWNRVNIYKWQFSINTINQKVLLDRIFWKYFLYEPITDEEYNYLTK